MVRNKYRKRVRGVKVIPGEQVLLLVCDIMMCAVKEVMKPCVPKGKVQKLKYDATRVDSENEFQKLAQAVGHIASLEDLWKSIKEDIQLQMLPVMTQDDHLSIG